jgi:CRISPR-associated protein Csb1
MGRIDPDRLVEQCSDDAVDAGITIRTELEPLAGPGAKVKPAVYQGGVFQLGRRWVGDGDERHAVDVIVIDNEPSQANRLEAALERMRGRLGLPELVLDLSSLEPLPPHVPRRLSSFRFPHRNADAYLRDAMVDGEDFLRTETGKAIADATPDEADALVEWFPQALLFGFWQSHLGKKGPQTKLARSWVSEIVGYEPAATDVRSLGLKGDPLNLTLGDGTVAYDDRWHERWEVAEKGTGSSRDGGKQKAKKLSDIGHGQVTVTGDDAALSGVSFRSVEQRASVSFASLRRVRTSVGSAEARALLVALGVVAHAGAFGRSFHLRSGCDLRPVATTWTWLGAEVDEPIDPPTTDEALALFDDLVARAAEAGLPVGDRWPDPVSLEPKSNLAKVIRETFPEPEVV